MTSTNIKRHQRNCVRYADVQQSKQPPLLMNPENITLHKHNKHQPHNIRQQRQDLIHQHQQQQHEKVTFVANTFMVPQQQLQQQENITTMPNSTTPTPIEEQEQEHSQDNVE